MTVPIIEFLVVIAALTFLSALWKLFCFRKREDADVVPQSDVEPPHTPLRVAHPTRFPERPDAPHVPRRRHRITRSSRVN